ncbi:MAG: caspase family protein [Crocosphaera sp.]|nr:caspase family protein [Crocosphaera sp.]
MKWDRRTFLQTLLTWGVAQESLKWLDKNHQLQKYYQTLAEPTHRKLALLVGINDYEQGFALKGCLTDVERQKDLLIHRFGFQGQDILTLTDKQATRKGIETAFREHLIRQAKPGDVVVFHFSGYGNHVKISPDIAPSITDGQLRGIIAQDGIKRSKGKTNTDNILEDTLHLLGRSLNTDKVTMVLDTSYHSRGEKAQGSLRVRSFPYISDAIDPEEFALQTKLKQNLSQKQATGSPGVILTAASPNQVAAEIKGNGFSAGLFTYTLTQYLWATAPATPINIILNKTKEQILPLIGQKQQPQQENSPKQPLFTYYLLPTFSDGAEAFVSAVEDNTTGTITLTGLSANLLRHYSVNSLFSSINGDRPSLTPPLQLKSCIGLKGKVRYLSQDNTSSQPLQVGQLLQESLRCLSRNPGLTVALDPKLQRIERVDATSAFSAIQTVADVVGEGEQPVDCILGLSASPSQPEQKGLSYSLFLPGGVELPNTIGKSGEAIKSAVERLHPTLDKLLAIKLWGLTLNENSSRLPLSVTLEGLTPEPFVIEQRQTSRGQSNISPSETKNTAKTISLPTELPKVARGTRLCYHIENQGEKPLYYLIVGIKSDGKAIAYLPNHEEQIEGESIYKSFIEPGKEEVIPNTATGLTWTISSIEGWEQIIVLSAIAPFQKTREALTKIAEFKPEKEQILNLENPLKIAQALLQDLTLASQKINKMTEPTADTYSLDVKAWSSISFIYQVV